MSSMKVVAALLLSVGVLTRAEAACNGLEAAVDAQSYDLALAISRGCLGDPAQDTHAVVADFNAATPDAAAPEKRLDGLVAALTQLRDFARARTRSSTDEGAWAEAFAELDDELKKAADENRPVPERLQSIRQSFWTLPRDGNSTMLNGTIRVLEPTGCGKPPARCDAYASRVDLLRVLKLMDRLIKYVDWPLLAAHFEDAKLMTERWDAYFNNALPQYWWEVALNGYLMDQNESAWEAPFKPFVKDEKLCEVDPQTKIQRGFCSVPQSQVIFLHPSAALQWVHGAHDTDDLAAAFVVELFGRNSWRWQEGDATLHNQFGWSLIAAYSNPGKEVEEWSYGIMLHKGGSLNLGITTDGNDQVSFVVNVGLAERFFTRRAEYLEFLKAVKKPSWESLL
ncbi:MAG: hypothetical protein ABW034_12450 [Steroidobacteraceae bacterium]